MWPRHPTHARIGGDDARLPLAPAGPARARRRRRGRPPDRPARAGGRAAVHARRRDRPRRGRGRPGAARRLRLPAHRHAGRAADRGLGRDPGRPRCTPQSAAFRDHVSDFAALGATLLGVSAQSPEDQAEFAARESIPYPLVSDEGLALARELRLPTFEAGGQTLYKRLTFVARAGQIEHVMYPVFPPDENAAAVLAWLGGAPR
jgi:peroxiredoxin